MFINGIDVNLNVYKVREFCNISPVTMDVGGVSLFSTHSALRVFSWYIVLQFSLNSFKTKS